MRAFLLLLLAGPAYYVLNASLGALSGATEDTTGLRTLIHVLVSFQFFSGLIGISVQATLALPRPSSTHSKGRQSGGNAP